MVSASVVPHHHHEGAVCVEISHEHEHESQHEGGCVAETEYTDRYDREEYGNPVICAPVPYGCEVAIPETPTIKIAVGDTIIIPHPLDALSGVGLRAPPAYIC